MAKQRRVHLRSTLGDGGNDERDSRGRFAKGNHLGVGNPLAGRAAKIRAFLLQELTDEDVKKIADRLIRMAVGGDIVAIRELLDRTVGKSTSFEINERIEALEQRMQTVVWGF